MKAQHEHSTHSAKSVSKPEYTHSDPCLLLLTFNLRYYTELFIIHYDARVCLSYAVAIHHARFEALHEVVEAYHQGEIGGVRFVHSEELSETKGCGRHE